MLASRILDVGKSFLSSADGSSSNDDANHTGGEIAVKWLKKALYLTERVERGDDTRGLGVSQLKVSSRPSESPRIDLTTCHACRKGFFEGSVSHFKTIDFSVSHRLLARAYFLASTTDPSKLSSAEEALAQLTAAADDGQDPVNP